MHILFDPRILLLETFPTIKPMTTNKNVHVKMYTEVFFRILKDWKLFLRLSLRECLINKYHSYKEAV